MAYKTTIVVGNREETVFGDPSFVVKAPGDLETYTFDFTKALGGSTVSTATVTEKTTSALTIASPSTSNPNVTVAISAGLVDNDYVVICKGTLADSDVVSVYLTIRVRES